MEDWTQRHGGLISTDVTRRKQRFKISINSKSLFCHAFRVNAVPFLGIQYYLFY